MDRLLVIGRDVSGELVALAVRAVYPVQTLF